MYRKGIYAFILNNQNQLLLVNLTNYSENFWYSIPGGGLENNESEIDALYREIFEELGITKDKLQMIEKSDLTIKYKFKSGTLVRSDITYTGQEKHSFLLKFIGDESNIKIDTSEIRNYVWAEIENLTNCLYFENQLEQTLEILRTFTDLKHR